MPISSHHRYLIHASSHTQHLRDATVEAEKNAYARLRELIDIVDGIGKEILLIQKAECDKHIQREMASGEEKELGVLRSDFVHQVEDSSRKRSRSYVSHSAG
jgi:hypothetical protein